MAWIYLLIAGLLEVVWATAMKQSQGFTKIVPTLVMAVTLVASFILLSIAMRTLPLGTAYMVWTGIGAIGAFVVGTTFLGEPLNAGRIIAACLIVAGMIVMKASDH